MSDRDKEKIIKFVNDNDMCEAVKSVLLKTFLKSKGDNVNYLAASMIAVGLLDEAFKELKKVGLEQIKEEKSRTNVGL